MAATTISQLGSKFAGLNELRYYSSPFTVGNDGTVTIGDTYIEMPCSVDTFSFSQAAPTINHYKIVGMDADWASSAQSGDSEISLNIPSLAPALLTAFWGDTYVKNATSTISGSGNPIAGSWSGKAVTLKKHKVGGAFVLINDTQDAILILNDVGLYATPSSGDSDTAPFYIALTGSIEGQNDNIIYLEKQAS